MSQNSLDSIIHLNQTILAKEDSATSHHHWRRKEMHCLCHIKSNMSNDFTLPNSVGITLFNQVRLPMSLQLLDKAQNAIILPELKSLSLVMIAKYKELQ